MFSGHVPKGGFTGNKDGGHEQAPVLFDVIGAFPQERPEVVAGWQFHPRYQG